MMDIAKALLIGRLTRDPEIRYTAKGTAVTTMRLAVNHRARDKKETSFFDVVTFGQLAETCGEYLSKGRAVLVDGRLREHSWNAPDGGRRSRIEVVAASVEFLDERTDCDVVRQGGVRDDRSVLLVDLQPCIEVEPTEFFQCLHDRFRIDRLQPVRLHSIDVLQ